VPEPKYTHTLLATLGGQPQVVTFTLDLLLKRGFPIVEVIVIHPHAAQEPLQHSLACLNAEFVGDYYRFASRTIHLRSHALQLDDALLDDITDDISANGALDTIHRLIRDLKRQPRCIHLSVTGGRRLMALTAISAAQLNFKHNIDHIWHIYTPEEVQQRAIDGNVMHSSPQDHVNLIELPFVPWKTYFSSPAEFDDASAKATLSAQVAHAEEYKRCKQVVQAITKSQLKVLQVFVEGKTPNEVADSLIISPSTISSHLSKIFDECRTAWDLPSKQRLDYHFLREHFASFFSYDE